MLYTHSFNLCSSLVVHLDVHALLVRSQLRVLLHGVLADNAGQSLCQLIGGGSGYVLKSLKKVETYHFGFVDVVGVRAFNLALKEVVNSVLALFGNQLCLLDEHRATAVLVEELNTA